MGEGKKFDGGKTRMDLLPVKPLRAVGDVLTFGADKYGDRNWELGIEYGRLYAAALRHLTRWWDGEDLDDESGMNHMAHATCCLMMLLHFVESEQDGLDDRPNG